MRISNLGQVIIFLKKARVKEYQEGAKVFLTRVETRICLEFKLNIGFNIVKILIFLLMVYKRKSRK